MPPFYSRLCWYLLCDLRPVTPHLWSQGVPESVSFQRLPSWPVEEAEQE